MVISSATGCGSNSNTSKELNISLYRLPGENRKLHGSKNFGEKSCRQMKISEYAIYILEKNVLSEICGYTVLIYIYTSHNLSIYRAESLMKLLWSYSEYCDSSCVFNYRSRHWDLCYNMVVLYVGKNFRKYLWKSLTKSEFLHAKYLSGIKLLSEFSLHFHHSYFLVIVIL